MAIFLIRVPVLRAIHVRNSPDPPSRPTRCLTGLPESSSRKPEAVVRQPVSSALGPSGHCSLVLRQVVSIPRCSSSAFASRRSSASATNSASNKRRSSTDLADPNRKHSPPACAIRICLRSRFAGRTLRQSARPELAALRLRVCRFSGQLWSQPPEPNQALKRTTEEFLAMYQTLRRGSRLASRWAEILATFDIH